MLSGDIQTLLRLLEGQSNGREAQWQGVSTDSRTIKTGELFIALDGPNFKGADFVASALARGAAAAMVSQYVDAPIAQVAVPDTRHALGVLAADWRASLPTRVIGVTGSNGKTTVKQMLAACLGPDTHATTGNLNNDIGVPLTLLAMRETHQRAVIEMGANHGGEIAYLASLVRPDVGLVTNAGPSHLEGFGSLDGVANAKGELFYSLGANSIAILNQDDRYYERWVDMAEPATIMTFGAHETADCYPSNVQLDVDRARFKLHLAGKTLPVTLPLGGQHNVMNACAAALGAYALGIEPADAAQRLSSVITAEHRLQLKNLSGNRALIDDSYNANPASMLAAADYALAIGRPVWMALGDMGELGPDESAVHQELGAALRARGVDQVYCTGPLMRALAKAFGQSENWFETRDALVERLSADWEERSVLVVKGSRSAGMEQVSTALEKMLGVAAHA